MKVQVEISARHIHFSQEDYHQLFDALPDKIKDLSQPGEYATDKTVTIASDSGEIPGVRVLMPFRKKTQIEISMTDMYKLKIAAPVRISGDLKGAPELSVNGKIKASVIIAKRHLHLNPKDGKLDDTVKAVFGGERGGTLDNVVVRSSKDFATRLHIDTDEANAMGASNGDTVGIRQEDVQ